MQKADLFESFDFIGPNLKTIDKIISQLKIDETQIFQETGKIQPKTHYKSGFNNQQITDSNQYSCYCEQQDCVICSQNINRNSFIFPDGISYSVYMFDGEKDIPQDFLDRIKDCCKKGLKMKESFHQRREGLFFANNMRDNPIFTRKNYETKGLVQQINSTQKLFFVGQRQEDFIFREYDNIEVDQEGFPTKTIGSYKKINIIVFFEVAYVFCTIFPILSLFENILFKFQHYISEKRCYFIDEKQIHKRDYCQTLDYIINNDSLTNSFINLKGIKPDEDKIIQCSKNSEFQIGKYHIHQSTNPLSKWIYVNMFKYVELDSLLHLIAITLLEKNLFICSQNITLLTSFMIGLEYLLKPLDYQSQYIYCLPQSFVEQVNLSDIPVPVVYGINSSYNKLISKKCNIQEESFIFDLDFKTLYSSDGNKLKIKKETDFITKRYLEQLHFLFMELQPHTKNQSFLKKMKLFMQPQKKNDENYHNLLKQFTLNFEFNDEEYNISEKIVNIFQQIFENDIIKAIKDEFIQYQRNHTEQSKVSFKQVPQIERSQSDSVYNKSKKRNNFYNSFKGTQIFQTLINQDNNSPSNGDE